MKRILTTVLCAITFFVSTLANETKPFNRVYVNIPSNIYFIEGEKHSMRIESENKYSLEMIECEVRDSVLKIDTKSYEDYIKVIEKTNEDEKVKIFITSPKQPTLRLGTNVELKKLGKGVTM